jgi:hypothetical protein
METHSNRLAEVGASGGYPKFDHFTLQRSMVSGIPLKKSPHEHMIQFTFLGKVLGMWPQK